MKFALVINPGSAFARAYAGCLEQTSGQDSMPVLFCTSMDASHHHFLHVETEQTERFPVPQSLHLPHSIVEYIVQYFEDQQKPAMGFA